MHDVLRQILSEFLTIPGVTAAALVGRDGFVIDAAAPGSPDYDALGALSSDALIFF